MENNREDHEIARLYEASMKGDVTLLDTLIREDALILQKISLTPFTETPLHAAALGGHLEFTKALLFHHPRLAMQVDSRGRSALHLASAEGHKKIVQTLLPESDGACLLHDQNGRIPLHYAAMRGRVEVLKELMNATPESIQRVVNGTGETVLHLCVKHSQLECLKLLVEKVGDDYNFINSKDSDGGKTILQLALTLNQIETVRYLLSVPIINAEASDVTRLLYVLVQHSLGDSRSLQHQQILEVNAGNFRRSEDNNDHVGHQQPRSPSTTVGRNKAVVDAKGAKASSRINKLMKCLTYPKDWLKKTRGMLMVVATVISTMTFQAAINPPGGVWQDNYTNSTNRVCSEDSICFAGTAIAGYLWEADFQIFINYNTIAFLSSLSVTLLVVSGFPLHNRVCMWLLSMAMCVTFTFMALTYLRILILVTPNNRIFDNLLKLYKVCFWLWISLLVMVSGIHTIRLFLWLLRWLRRSWFKHKMPKFLRNMVSNNFNFAPITNNEETNVHVIV